MFTQETPTVKLKHAHSVQGGYAARQHLRMTPSQHATRPPVTTVQPWGSSRRVCEPTCPSGQTLAIVSLERSPHAGDTSLHRTAAATRELVRRDRRTYLALHRPATHNGQCAKGEPVATCRATLTLTRLHKAAISVQQPSSAALHACTHVEKHAEAAKHRTITGLSFDAPAPNQPLLQQLHSLP